MKKIITFLSLLCAPCLFVNAQVTIASADLPHANEIYRISIGQDTVGVDLSVTGPMSVWDYSHLLPNSQRVDSFIDEAATNSIFSIVFIDFALNPNRSNQATQSGNFNLGTLISLSDVYNFYYNSGSSYKQVGFGANVNGIPLPITYSPHDIIYNLPLQYLATDSSVSGYAVDLTSTLGIYYKANRSRKNEVDGWGNLVTPFGSFSTLRVHSTIIQEDSLYLDTLGFGIQFPQIISHEYKWLGIGQGVPLLQINTTANGIVTQIVYKDSLRSLVGIDKLSILEKSIKLFPNPATTEINLSYTLEKNSLIDLEIYSVDAKRYQILDSQFLQKGEQELTINLSDKNIAEGNYFLRMTINGIPYIKPFIVTSP